MPCNDHPSSGTAYWPCGHDVCAECAKGLIKWVPSCPDCLQPHHGHFTIIAQSSASANTPKKNTPSRSRTKGGRSIGSKKAPPTFAPAPQKAPLKADLLQENNKLKGQIRDLTTRLASSEGSRESLTSLRTKAEIEASNEKAAGRALEKELNELKAKHAESISRIIVLETQSFGAEVSRTRRMGKQDKIITELQAYNEDLEKRCARYKGWLEDHKAQVTSLAATIRARDDEIEALKYGPSPITVSPRKLLPTPRHSSTSAPSTSTPSTLIQPRKFLARTLSNIEADDEIILPSSSSRNVGNNGALDPSMFPPSSSQGASSDYSADSSPTRPLTKKRKIDLNTDSPGKDLRSYFGGSSATPRALGPIRNRKV